MRLREHTEDAHQRLHELEIFRALLDGSLARSAYRRLLACLHDYYQRVDTELDSACREFQTEQLNYRYHARAPLFARDLAVLGADEPYQRQHHAAVLPSLDSAASLAGALYVIEGSLLGGASLDHAARKLLASRDSGDIAGRHYWAWCREVGVGRWQHTSALIDGWLDTPTRTAQALAAARATFEQLHAWLLPLNETPC